MGRSDDRAVSNNADGTRFATLDAMRGVAAIAVLMIHMGGEPAKVLSGGYLAVDFFFCLSGFVLAHAYGDKQFTTAQFLTVRAIRLYPLYLAGLGLGVALLATRWTAQTLWAAVLGLMFLPSPFSVRTLAQLDFYPLNPPAWSLFFEIVANLAWFPLRRWLRGWPGVWALGLCAVAFLSCAVAYGSVSTGEYWDNAAGGLGRVAYSFLAGVLTYRLWRHTRLEARLPSWAPVILLLAVFCAPVPRQVSDPIIVLLLVPPLVFMGACCTPSIGLAGGVERSLGSMSYAIYALHLPIIVGVDRWLIDGGLIARMGVPLLTHHPSALTTPLTVAVVLGLAWSLDKIYDRPVRRWLGTKASAAARPDAAVAQG
jgi:peptidoglycan/LPS O-acetylase OafA/YrhL